jgi:hypothetical protein
MKQSKAFQEWYGSASPEGEEFSVWVFEVPNLKTKGDQSLDPSPIKRCRVTSTGEDHFFIAYRNYFTRKTEIGIFEGPRETLDESLYLHGGVKGTIFVSVSQEKAEEKREEILQDIKMSRQRKLLEQELQSSVRALKLLLHEEALKWAGISPFLCEIRGKSGLPLEDLERHRAGLDALRLRLEKHFADS